jgi:hypothetical protein
VTQKSTLGPGVPYEVVLAPAAIRTLLDLPEAGGRKELADALRTELLNGPNASSEFKFDSDMSAYSDPAEGNSEMIYTATPLSFGGYTVVHRKMTAEELARLEREQGRSTARRGFYIIDIFSAESAFSRSAARRV